jgi:tRNA threonylcarbamoyladenosine biosynthesis protein TsaB
MGDRGRAGPGRGALTVLVLAVETATESAGVALADERGLLAMETTEHGRRHAEAVVPFIVSVCRRAGVALGGVDALAVDVGPGLFTGLRVGIATVKALALALGLPVVGATSLEILATAVRATYRGDPALVVSVVDARRGEVFWAPFETDGERVTQVGADAIGPPESLAAALGPLGRPCFVVGDGALRYATVLGAVPGVRLATDALAHPPVDVLAGIGLWRSTRGEHRHGAEIAAHYLRDADARIHWEQRAARPVAPRAPGLSPMSGA